MSLLLVARGLVGVIAVATLLLPTDSLPDVIPFIGWLDDLIAAGYLVVELLKVVGHRRSDRGRELSRRP